MNSYDNLIVHFKFSDRIEEFKEYLIEDLDKVMKILNEENFMDFLKMIMPIIDQKNYDEEIINIVFLKIKNFLTNPYQLDPILKYLIDNRKFGYNKFLSILVDKLLNEDTLGFFLYNKKNHMFSFLAKKKILDFYKKNVINYLDDLSKLIVPEEEIYYFKREDKKLTGIFVKYLKNMFSKDIIVKENLKWINDENSYFERIGNKRGLRYIRKQIKTFVKKEHNILIIKLSLHNRCQESKFHDKCEDIHCHRNLLIFDKRSNKLERFEPFGKFSSKKYNTETMDSLLYDYFKKKNINYIGTKNCLFSGFQKIQSKSPIEIKFIKEFLPIQKYKNVLDFVCGFGRHSIELANAGEKYGRFCW